MKKRINIEAIAKQANYDEKTIRGVFAAAIGRVPTIFIGPPGTGKTLLAKTIETAFSDSKMSRLQGHSEASYTDSTGKADIPAAMRDGVTKTTWNTKWLSANINFVDEVNRMPMNAQNALLSQMAEGIAVRVPGQEHAKEKAWWIFTCNYEDDSTFGMMAPLSDRIGVSFTIGHPNMIQFLNPSHSEIKLEKYGSIEDWWRLCDEVKVPQFLELELKAKLRSTSSCKWGEKSEINPDACANCSFRLTACGMIESEGFGWRPMDAILRLAKGLAIIDGRTTVNFTDMLEAMKLSLYHRTYGKFNEHFEEYVDTLPKRIQEALNSNAHHVLLGEYLSVIEKHYSESIGTHNLIKQYCKLNSMSEKDIIALRKACGDVAGLKADGSFKIMGKSLPTAVELAKALIAGIDDFLESRAEPSYNGSTIEITTSGRRSGNTMFGPNFWNSSVEFPYNNALESEDFGEYSKSVRYNGEKIDCRVEFANGSIVVECSKEDYAKSLRRAIQSDDMLMGRVVKSVS